MSAKSRAYLQDQMAGREGCGPGKGKLKSMQRSLELHSVKFIT